MLDGADGGATGISVLRNGKMLGGGSVLYQFGSYHCSNGKWKGEVTSQEHTPTIDVRPFAGHFTSMGFAGTYTDEGAEFEATALVWASEAFDSREARKRLAVMDKAVRHHHDAMCLPQRLRHPSKESRTARRWQRLTLRSSCRQLRTPELSVAMTAILWRFEGLGLVFWTGHQVSIGPCPNPSVLRPSRG